MNRRRFLHHTTATSLATVASSSQLIHGADAASKKLRVAVVGLGRGMAHVQALLKLPNVEIAYLAEVDPKRLERGLQVVAATQPTSCQGVKDFRKFLSDSQLDAVFIATPNFWHTPAALLAMQAGKHVYVEKPGSQNVREAEMIVEAAEKYDRIVQMGNQRRTWMKEGIQALHDGAIGKVKWGRAFYYNTRKALLTANTKGPEDTDYDLWQGPVPDDAGHDRKNLVHYDWHWLWHWGNGELGNNGIHYLDILRWGLKVETPLKVSYTGGRYFYKDEQETPDTGTAVYDCGDVGFEWVQSSSHPRAAEKPLGECLFYGDQGTMALTNSGWTIFDMKGKEMSKGKSTLTGDTAHIGNFLDSIRNGTPLNSPISEGQKSTLLCHWGNIAYRTNSLILLDPKTRKIINNPAAEKLLSRPEYRWEVKV